ncbi:MAG: hypothetical protein ABFR62_13580 [Bacteroidota bacterium]
MNKRKIYITLVFLAASIFGFSQEKIELKLVAKSTENSIILRWAPADANSWQLNNKYGVKIERYTLKRNNVFLDKPEKQLLTFAPLKPAELKYWEQDVEKDDYVAISAQSIYGEEFELSSSNDISSILDRNSEMQNRFSFALLACDISARAAELSGLRYEDKTAKKGEVYLYKVISEIKDPSYTVEEVTAYLGLEDYEPLGMAPEISAKLNGEAAELQWSHYYHKRIFIAYYIERSEDGTNFKRINETPFTVLDVEKNNYIMQRVEQLPDFEKEYYFRIKGIDAFGDISPGSNVIKVKGEAIYTVSAQINDKFIDSENNAVIKWQIENGKAEDVEAFVVERAFDIKGNFAIISDSLNFKENSYTDTNSSSSNYYRVKTISKSGEVKKSFPVLLQPADSVAPGAPVNLKAVVSKKGIVKLGWNKGKEADLLGYRVYRSRDKNGEFQQITKKSIDINSYSDTLNLGSLDKHYWYKVTAEDNRYNTSEYSEIIHVIKPDTIAPSSPVFTKAIAKRESNHLQWVVSGSDLGSIKLYRKSKEKAEWSLLKTYSPVDSMIVDDIDIKNGTKYYYTLSATDSSGNESIPGKAVSLTANIENGEDFIKDLKAEVKRNQGRIELTWKNSEENIEISLYRLVNDGKPSLIKKLEDASAFMDAEVKMGNSYKYFLKVTAFGNNKARWVETGVFNF